MPIIRRKLDPNEVYPETMRYDADTNTVQSMVNGSWMDNPAADPRTQTTLPPRITSNPGCDAAQSVADAFKNTVDHVLTLISESKTLFTLGGAILALFEFGPFGVLIVLALALASVMLDAGTAAIEAALTSTAWDLFKCALYCHMNSLGRVNPGEIPDIQSKISDQIGGLGATILNAMLFLAGEGGVNNLASLGTSTGDCSDCDCSPCEISNWEVFSGSETYGVIIETGINYIVADLSYAPATVGEYFLRMKTSGGVDECCIVTHIEVIIDGTVNLVAGKACGGAQDGTMTQPMTLGTGSNAVEINSFYVGSVTASRVKIFFTG